MNLKNPCVLLLNYLLQWVYGMPMNDSRGYSAEEKQLAKQIMSYWANFARTG